jgi:hypothetical protein
MPEHNWLFLGGFLLLSIAIVVAGGAVVFRSLYWIGSSDSERATQLRLRLGWRRRPGSPVFFWGDGGKERRESAREFARKHSRELLEKDPALLPRLAPFHLLFHDSSAGVENIIRWRRNRQTFTLASYTFELSETARNGFLLVELGELSLPPFLVRGKSWFQAVAHSGRNIEIAEDPKFTSQYQLEGDDPAAVRALFDESLRTALKGVENCAIECRGDALLFFHPDDHLLLEDREAFVDESLALFAELEKAGRRASRFRS